MHKKLVFSNVNQFLFFVLCAFHLSFKKWLFSQHQVMVHDYKTFCKDVNCVYIITAFLKTMVGINYFDNRPAENVKLGSVKVQP